MTVESHFQRTRTIAARFQSAHPFLDDLDCKIPRTPHQCDPVGGQTRSPSPSAFPFRRLVVWWVFDERSTMFTRPSHRFTKSTHLASAGFTGPNLTTQPYSVGSTRLLMTVRLWCPLLVLCTAHSTDQSKYTKRLDGAGWDPALETYPGPTFASKMRSPQDEIRALLHSVLPPTGVPGRVTIWCIYPAFALPPSLLSLSLSLSTTTLASQHPFVACLSCDTPNPHLDKTKRCQPIMSATTFGATKLPAISKGKSYSSVD